MYKFILNENIEQIYYYEFNDKILINNWFIDYFIFGKISIIFIIKDIGNVYNLNYISIGLINKNRNIILNENILDEILDALFCIFFTKKWL